MRNIADKTDGSGDVLYSSAFNTNLLNELQGFVSSAGFTLDPETGPDTDTSMFAKSAVIHSTASQYFDESGAANAYILTRTGTLESLYSYINGTIVFFKAGNSNTGASTINIDSIGVKNLVASDGSALTGGEVVAGAYTIARYNGSTDDFEVVSVSGGGGSSTELNLPISITTDLTGNGIKTNVTVDTNATGIGALLYESSDGNYDEADASADTTVPVSALALESGTGSKSVLLQGFVRNDAWAWTPGATLFLSTTTGAMTETAPSTAGEQVQVVGKAETATVVYFDPDSTVIEVNGGVIDATTLNGQAASYYLDASNINAGIIGDAYLPNSISSNITGNAATATALDTARTINGTSFDGTANITTTSWGTSRTFSLTGDVTGSTSVDGSGNISIATTGSNLAKLNVDNVFLENLYLENSKYLLGSNLAGTVDFTLIGVDASDIVRVGTTSATLNLRSNSTTVLINGTDTIWSSGNDSNLAKLNGTQTFSGTNTFSASPVLVNNIFLRGLDTGASSRGLIGLTSSDVVQVGGGALPTDIISSGTIGILQSDMEFDNNKSIYFQNNAATPIALVGLNSSNQFQLGSTSYVTNIKSSASLTRNTTLTIFDSGNLSTDDTLAGDSDTTAVSESAVKGYVDTAVAGGITVLSFKNTVINGNFDYWQWGTTQASGTNNYGSDDRWRNGVVGSTRTVSQISFTQGQTDVPGSPTYYSRTAISSAGAATTDFVHKVHHIENVHTFSGQQVTLSFWAKASTSINMSSEFVQHPGTGGSPGSPVTTIAVTTHALTTSWQKFTVTTTLPNTTSGDITLGTNGDHTLRIFFWYSAGSSFNSRTNSLGLQTGSFDIAQVQLELGPTATPFEQRPKQVELALCQRYFQKSYNVDVDPGTSGNPVGYLLELSTRNNAAYAPGTRFPVKMRDNPSVTIYSPYSGTINTVDEATTDRAATAVTIGEDGFLTIQITGSSTAAGVNWHYTADAELY